LAVGEISMATFMPLAREGKNWMTSFGLIWMVIAAVGLISCGLAERAQLRRLTSATSQD
jgi:hypothetical protein